MFIFVLYTIVVALLFGFLFPYRAAWLVVFLVPLLGPSGLYIGIDTIFPLTAYRIGFFILLAIIVRLKINVIKKVLRNKHFRILIIYSITLFLLQLRHYPVTTLFTLLPYYSLAIFIPFIIIRSTKDIYKFANILTMQSLIISVFILIEYFTDFSLIVFIMQLSGFEESFMHTSLQTKGYINLSRGGFYRPAGLHGNSVQTAYHLVFLLPFTLFYAQYSKKFIISFIPLILILCSFILLQTRASIIAIVAMIMFVLFLGIINKNIKSIIPKLIGMLVIVTMISLIISLMQSEIFTIAKSSIMNLYYTLTGSNLAYAGGATVLSDKYTGLDVGLGSKLTRIPIAFGLIMNSPIFGYLGSPHFAYDKLMHGADLPLLILHLLGGGLIFGTLFTLLMFRLVSRTYSEIDNNLPPKLNNLIFYSTVAIFGGFFVTLSNLVNEHFISMFMLFAVIKVYKESLSQNLFYN